MHIRVPTRGIGGAGKAAGGIEGKRGTQSDQVRSAGGSAKVKLTPARSAPAMHSFVASCTGLPQNGFERDLPRLPIKSVLSAVFSAAHGRGERCSNEGSLRYAFGALVAGGRRRLIMGSTVVGAAPPVSLQPDGSLQIAARKLRCGDVRNVLDARLLNLGISVPDAKLLVINPALVARQPGTVRLFVYHHECGHHHVGASERGADCWAVRRGVREGWLDSAGLAQICKSFANAPATATHPSGARRCGNLSRCFAAAVSKSDPSRSALASPQIGRQ